MKRFLVSIMIIFIVLLQVNTFPQNPRETGMQLYIAGMDAFQNGEYEKAQRLLERTLIIYPDIESKVKNIKLILGIASFYCKDYEKAKTYLKLFKDNPIAQELLKKIPENVDEESIESMSFLNKLNPPEEPQTNAANQTSTPVKELNNPMKQFFKLLLFGLIIFLLSFLSLLFVEYKFKVFSGLIEKLFSRLPLRKVPVDFENIDNDFTEAEVNYASSPSNTSFPNIDIEEYSKKDLEGIEEMLKEMEKEDDVQVIDDMKKTSSKADTSTSPREAILSSFNEGNKESKETFEDLTDRERNYFDDEELKSKVEKLIKDLGIREEDLDWTSLEELPENLSEKIEQLETKEEYSKEEIERILKYASYEVTKKESG